MNENAGAEGELKIAVANAKLPAESEKWTPVKGSVAFSHKRLFNVSLLGVEAKYVKLSFDVQQEGRIASLGLCGGRTLTDCAERASLLPDEEKLFDEAMHKHDAAKGQL